MAARSFLSAYLLIGVLNVVGHLTANSDATTLTKPLLMPLLALWLVAEARHDWSRSFTWVAVGLSFAWVGDLLLMPDGDVTFALGIGAFLITQISYTAAFRTVPGVRFRRDILITSEQDPRGLVRRHRWILAAFGAYYVVLMVLVLPTAGPLGFPVALYGLVICIMAASALDLVGRMPGIAAWLTFAGALLFVVSDSLIALTALGPWVPGAALSASIMATYVIGQGLLVVSFVSGVRDNRAALDPGSRSGRSGPMIDNPADAGPTR